mgnify:CR=1 FL=1
MQPKLAIIVPTLNERGNIPMVYEQVKSTLIHEAWELIFVDDDSSDGTCNTVLEIAAKDSRVRILQRINRKGLSSACIEGMLSSSAPLLGVMDADLQHDVTLLPLMLEALNDDGLDIAIGSRYMFGGGTGEWHPFRIFVSHAATQLSKVFIGNNITDPMSGFFMLRRTCFLKVAPSLSGRGFKILLDILTSNNKICTKELPYQFGKRTVGESKFQYEVDRDWLRHKPAFWELGQCADVGVDSQDRVWLFSRSKHPVSCWTTEGQFIGNVLQDEDNRTGEGGILQPERGDEKRTGFKWRGHEEESNRRGR